MCAENQTGGDRPLVVVHTEASDGWGGQDIRVLREAEWFRTQGHHVYLVTPPTGGLFQHAASAGFSPIPMGLNKRTRIADFFRLRRLFRSLRPDGVATHSSIDSWMGLTAAAAVGVPCRLRYRHVSTPVRPNPLNRWMYRRLASHAITTADFISRHLIEQLGLSPDRVTAVPTGVERPAALPSHEEARRTAAAELGLPDTARFIGQVSVLRSWKGHADLMAAFDRLAADDPHLHLLIVGEGPYRWRVEEDRRAAESAGRIHLIGHRENPWPLLRAMSVCCLCSIHSEGVPQALEQAMLAGTPVVGTDVGGIPELIRPGETGLLVPHAAPAALAAAISGLLADPPRARAMAHRAERVVAVERNPDVMGRAVLRIMRRALAAAGP